MAASEVRTKRREMEPGLTDYRRMLGYAQRETERAVQALKDAETAAEFCRRKIAELGP